MLEVNIAIRKKCKEIINKSIYKDLQQYIQNIYAAKGLYLTFSLKK